MFTLLGLLEFAEGSYLNKEMSSGDGISGPRKSCAGDWLGQVL